jgi:hypothetical protein
MFDEILARLAKTSPGVELTLGCAAKPELWAESVSQMAPHDNHSYIL